MQIFYLNFAEGNYCTRYPLLITHYSLLVCSCLRLTNKRKRSFQKLLPFGQALIVRKLQLVNIAINLRGREQLLVRTLCDDAALIHDDD